MAGNGYSKNLTVGEQGLVVKGTSEFQGKTYFGSGLCGKDTIEDEMGVGGYYANVSLGVFDDKDDDQRVTLIPGYNSYVAGCPFNMLQEAYSGTAYPFKGYGDISYGGKLPNGSIIYFGFCGKKSAGAAGYPRMFLYKSPWTWGVSVGINDESWASVFSSTAPSGTDNGAIYCSIYHYTSGASGTSYARGAFINFITHPWGDRYTG